MFEARDLLSELFDLVFEVFLPAPDAGVTGFEDAAEAVDGTHRGPADEAGAAAYASEGGLAGGASGWGGGEEAGGETRGGPEDRSENDFRRAFAHK